jgi:hypothetical protein
MSTVPNYGTDRKSDCEPAPHEGVRERQWYEDGFLPRLILSLRRQFEWYSMATVIKYCPCVQLSALSNDNQQTSEFIATYSNTPHALETGTQKISSQLRQY